jgi:TPR repeat protein
MARFELLEVERTCGGDGSGHGCLAHASLEPAPATAEALYSLGIMYAVGQSVPVDLVSAHKWFNLAAMRGNKDAVRMRSEIAQEMSETEIAQAQRAARAWVKAN